MADIFGYTRSPKARGVFSTENSSMTFGASGGGTSAEAYLVQNWNLAYQQQVQELFEIGSNNLYWAKGRPVGSGAIGRVIGDKEVIAGNAGTFFPEDAYDLCKGGVMLVLEAKGGHCDDAPVAGVVLDKGVRVTMDGCCVTQIGFSMQVADVRLMEQIGWRFAYMEVTAA